MFLRLKLQIIIIINNIIIIIIIIITFITFTQGTLIIYLKQTICLRYTVLQLFCIYNLCYS